MLMPCGGSASTTADTMVRLVAKLRDWEPLDWDATFDALASVLDCQAPLDDELEELAQRLRGALMQIVTIAVAGLVDEDKEAAVLIARARTLRSVELPGNYWMALGHLRRLGWVTSELVELLSKTGHLKDAA
ncbi:DUF6415 family natural product biosynthesis protein [Streptomyces akebiae]|uniref:Uncharacterized protein n=1 Tax=Streptomyces akebiae TaxID=2865673 RepID=A0ABX8XX84_9ACTN|nr:DUF6415 family natural product biosynthesis protein [Streptomyces akebiae]QYX80248.1 hypothetical protein K1J60_30310 [Streptomyces akebiae]